MAKTSPTQRSLKVLRDMGYHAQVVERFNQFARVRVDLWGFVDILAMRDGELLGVQATSGPNVAARLDKAMASPLLDVWLSVAKFEVWGWSKQGARGKRKLWTLTRRPLERPKQQEMFA